MSKIVILFHSIYFSFSFFFSYLSPFHSFPVLVLFLSVFLLLSLLFPILIIVFLLRFSLFFSSFLFVFVHILLPMKPFLKYGYYLEIMDGYHLHAAIEILHKIAKKPWTDRRTRMYLISHQKGAKNEQKKGMRLNKVQRKSSAMDQNKSVLFVINECACQLR